MVTLTLSVGPSKKKLLKIAVSSKPSWAHLPFQSDQVNKNLTPTFSQCPQLWNSNNNGRGNQWVTATTVKGHLPSTSTLRPTLPHNGQHCLCVSEPECGKDNLIQFSFLLPKDVPEFAHVSLDCFAVGGWGLVVGGGPAPQKKTEQKWHFLRQCLDLETPFFVSVGWNSWVKNISLVIEVHNFEKYSPFLQLYLLSGEWSKGYGVLLLKFQKLFVFLMNFQPATQPPTYLVI